MQQNKTFQGQPVTVVRENPDGTTTIKLADGTEKNVKKDQLQDAKS